MVHLNVHFDTTILTEFIKEQFEEIQFFLQNSRYILNEARILKFYPLNKLNVASLMYKILKQEIYPMLAPSL